MYPVSRTYKYAEEDEVSWEGPAHVLATSQYNYADQCSDAGNNNINSVIFIKLEHSRIGAATVRRRTMHLLGTRRKPSTNGVSRLCCMKNNRHMHLPRNCGKTHKANIQNSG